MSHTPKSQISMFSLDETNMMKTQCDDCDLLKECSKLTQNTSKIKKLHCAEGKPRQINDGFSSLEAVSYE
jgi:hypothetical protein